MHAFITYTWEMKKIIILPGLYGNSVNPSYIAFISEKTFTENWNDNYVICKRTIKGLNYYHYVTRWKPIYDFIVIT